MHKSGHNSINANFVFPYICSFVLRLHHLMFVNVNFNVSGCKLSLVLITSNGMDKSKLAILAFLHCGYFVKTSIDDLAKGPLFTPQ